jgi:hypothetical protein
LWDLLGTTIMEMVEKQYGDDKNDWT